MLIGEGMAQHSYDLICKSKDRSKHKITKENIIIIEIAFYGF